MSFHVRLAMSNTTQRPLTVTVPAGSVFEVMDPFSNVQNLMTAQAVSVVIPPGQAQVVEIESWCLNKTFAPPSQTPLRPTPFRPRRPYSSQADLWGDLGQRR